MALPVIIDASVFAKLFLDEEDSEEAVGFFRFAERQFLTLMAPALFLYEVLALAGPSVVGSNVAYEKILKLSVSGFQLIEIGDKVIRMALQISNSGHPKSGYPTFYDSAYHALALVNGGIFLTSDQRHVAKASAFGSVVLLKDWRGHFHTANPS